MTSSIGRSIFPLLAIAVAARAQDGTALANVRYGDIPGQDAQSYAITLRVDLANKQLVGEVRYEFTATAAIGAVRLDALRSDDWHVRFTTAAGDDLPAAWTADQVTLTLPETAAAGSTIRFTAHLDGTPVDGFYFADNRYGERLAFTDHYSIRARGWLPCEDNPADRARFSLLLHYPQTAEAIGFGAPATEPAGSSTAPDGYRSVYLAGASEIPPYMLAIVVGPFARVHEDGDPRLADHLVYRADADKAKAMLTHDAMWLQTMERTFGPYPFAKYATVQCPTRWGGFEAPGNVQLAEGLFDDDARGTSTLAHELVHMWFGDGVGYAEWREVWLAEGFASYFGPWLHAAAGGPPLPDSLRAMRDRWLHGRDGITKSIRDDRFPHPDLALNTNTYQKGAWVLHMLRGELGDEAFFAALKAYFAACRGRSVRTADFVAAVEKSCKRDLGWFFAQWLDRIGCPELRFSAANGKVVVEQLQKGDPYVFWLRLRTKEGIGEQFRVRVDQARQELAIDGPPERLVVDPEVELLFRPAR
ncbi:MAG: M1 family aminopeptidase [Planctomycetota bacterium]